MKNMYEKALYSHFALELNYTPLFFCCGLFIKITLHKGIPLHHKTVLHILLFQRECMTYFSH